MIEIKRAIELGEKAKMKISEIFVDGFGEHLTFFSKDHKKLAEALEHMFILDVFYVAMIDGEIAGITACTNGKVSSVNHDKKELIKHLGFVKGTIADIVFKREFQKPPIEIGEKIASVEFVSTALKYRGKGVATAIMNYLFAFPQYNEYILEVADTNTKAMKLYEKLGYKEFKRIKQKHSKISGVNYLVYMKYSKPKDQKDGERMNITINQKGDSKVAVVESSEIIISDIQDALDLMASVNYNYECHKILISQSNLTEEFFELRTKLAGEILQKYVNYNVKLAIVGNFDKYNSKSLKDFIYECNKGKQVFFLEDKQDALQALHNLN